MSKNINMLKCFFKVLNNIDVYSVLPNMYQKDIYSIDYKYLKNKGIKGIIFDIDNTILPTDEINVSNKLINQINKIKALGFKICLMSNNNKERVYPVSSILNVDYIYKAGKPNKEAFDKAERKLRTNKLAMVGDQMLSDIKGSNDYGIYSIMVDPISNKNNIQTKTSRILQNILENKLAKLNLFKKGKYYKEMIK